MRNQVELKIEELEQRLETAEISPRTCVIVLDV